MCVVLSPGVCLLCWSDVLLARPGQQRVRLLAAGQTQRIQHDRLWRWEPESLSCRVVVRIHLLVLRGFKTALMWLTDPSPVSGPGLEMAWVVRPPETVKTGEVFNVTYSVTASDSFYRWAVDNHIFTHRWVHLTAGYTGFKLDRLHKRSSTEIFVGLNCVCVFSSIATPEQARRFCEHHDCPANWKDANGENCCIHHANIHSCPLGYMVHTLGYFQLLHVLRCLLHSAANWQNKSLKKCNQNTLINQLLGNREHLRSLDPWRRKDLHTHHLDLRQDDPDQLDRQGTTLFTLVQFICAVQHHFLSKLKTARVSDLMNESWGHISTETFMTDGK